MEANVNILLQKLDRFIKRYYKNFIIRGGIYFIATGGILLLTYSLLEYFGYFSSLIRGILFYSFIIITVFVFIKHIFIPVLKLFRIGKVLDKETAARLVGKHFRGVVDDKILNVIQLHRFLEKDQMNVNLLLASIDQKSKELVKFKFDEVIKFSQNKKYLLWAVIPVIVIVLLSFISPFIIYEPAKRIVRYETSFERPAPFSISIKNDSLRTFQNDDFKLRFEIVGDILPETAQISYDGVEYRANKENKSHFDYSFNNVRGNKEFFIVSEGYHFGPYELDVVTKPVINNFLLEVNSPHYTGIEDETYRNYGDIRVAEGSEVKMHFNTRYTESMELRIGERDIDMEQIDKGEFKYNTIAYESLKYKVLTSNEHTKAGDSLENRVEVIPDRYPEIAVEQYEDTVLLAHKFFSGNIRDDYGFSELKFKYRIFDDHQKERGSYQESHIEIDEDSKTQTFNFHFNLDTLDISPGQNVEYYFAVWDNDQVNGPKKTKSRDFYYRIPDHKEIAEQSMKTYEDIDEEISTNISESSQTRDDLEKLRRDLLDRENIGWQEKEQFKELLEKHENLQEKINELSQQKRESELRDEQFREQDEKLKKEQERLQEEFENAISDEMRELFDQISDELDKIDRDEMFKYLEEMEFEFSQFEHQMERLRELYKMLEFRNLLHESVQKTDRLRERQEELMDQLEREGEYAGDEGIDKQEDIKENFDDLEEFIEQINEKNRELGQPQNLPDTRDVQHNIDYDIQKALEELMEGNMQDAHPHQQETADGLQQLSDILEDFRQSLFQDELAEDAQMLRQMLENLIKTSFNQEDLMEEVRRVNINDPRYVEMIQEQRKIFNDLEVIEDSLEALSKRQVHVQSYINREIAEINMNIEKAIDDLIERRRNHARSRQQFVMTHINNLALLLNESLQDMQMEMAMQGGFGDKDESGADMPSFDDIIDQQEEVNQMLEQIREGHEPEPGETGEEMSLSEQLARMSTQQEKVREELRKLTEEFKKDLDVNTRELEQMQKEMEQTEMDIITDNITSQTMIRQERIITKLLEHEDALVEREQEEKRVGEVPEFYELSNPEEIFEYNRERRSQVEMLEKKNLEFNRFFNELIEQYLIKLRE